MQHGSPDTIILDTPRDPYVSVGFFKDPSIEVDTEYCATYGIPVYRRETGGGVVYIDKDQLFIQWIFSRGQLPARTDTRFEYFIAPLVETYRHFGVNARYQPPNDVHVRSRKIVGTGAATIGNAEVVTGNILFDFNAESMTNILKVPDETFRALVRDSLDSYMTSLRRELETVPDEEAVKEVYVLKCEEHLGCKITRGEFTDAEYRMIEEMDEKFTSEEWFEQGITSKPSKPRVVKIHAGVWLYEIVHETANGVRLHMHIRTRNGKIDIVHVDRNISFEPQSRLEGLENVLRNVHISEESLTEMVSGFYQMHSLQSPGIGVEDWVSAILQIETRK